MVAYRLVLAGFVAAASASAFPAEDQLFKTLLKRQEPGTPAYDCHDNCGTAIVNSRGDDPCNDDAFVHNYNNCLQCSGPDNYNIWRYYGGSLGAAGSKCGFDTTPLSGKQPDVSPADHSSGSGNPPEGAVSSAPPASSAPAPSSTPAPASEPQGEPTQGTTAGPAPSSAPVSSAPPAPSSTPEGSDDEPTQGSTEAPAPSGTSQYPVDEPPYPTTKPSGVHSSSSGVPSGVPAPSGNGTATFTSAGPPEQTVNAAAGLDVSKAAGVLGAMVFGVVYGF